MVGKKGRAAHGNERMRLLRPSNAFKRQASCARSVASEGARHFTGSAARLVVLADPLVAAGEADELYDALEQFSGRSAGWGEDDNLEAKGEREARAEDGNAAHRGCNQVNQGCIEGAIV